MSCHSTVTEWTTMIRTYLPQLSKPQATVLALWSLGMVLARSCALTAVATFLAVWLRRQEQTVRQQLRECCDEAEAKRGDQRQALCCRALFCAAAGLGAEPLAGHPTGLGPRCHHPGHALHGVGHQRGLSRLCHAGGLDHPAGQPAPCLAPRVAAPVARSCGQPSPRAGPSSCWPIVACMPAGCFGVSSAWAGIPSCASMPVARFGLGPRHGLTRCSPSRRRWAPAGAARAPPSRARSAG